mmetsp:Transcript_26804/g.39659  ORF Transcript_26804/g.39659 Transcript_26804/m.39659 type:complete len:389 (-) Transcript_26804:818-1984(-)|eukprot:CAMPEP_0195506744 /NCGR_PEP_ID=MMETSP0794_2-20130614/310_1 /TAXON_ID=515487 /ORGANISM="Stephanopyxis turris, Strain CCMP 815" /LENGTH=388 /DNA_ID=CAMNT_0040633159 /DNA_START=295 /DNA_END=1461 /DNA_ORIENTATION=+
MADKDDAPLPPGWTKAFSRSNQRYFWSHAETKTSQWHPPTKDEANDPAKAKQAAESKAKLEREEMQRKKPSSSSSSRSSSNKKHDSSSSSSSSKKLKVDTAVSRSQAPEFSKRSKKPRGLDDSLSLAESTNVAIIVPYRDLHPAQNRSKHLEKFIPHMLEFLKKQVAKRAMRDYHIYIVEQSDDGRKFNRGKLLNIGFDFAKKSRHHDVYIFHDVDLLPGDDLGSWYSRFPKTPIHIARCWGRYSNNPKYFGGIVSFSASDMRRINGYPNTFWGWGGEDDEMQKRCEKLRIAWEAPPKGTIQDLENMSLKEKLDFLRANKKWKCMVKWEALDEHEKTWRTNGLSDLSYSVLSKTTLDAATDKATKLAVDVKLNGNHWGNDKCGVDYTY